jgi:hypothetical protein
MTRAMTDNFDPNSPNAMFATILAKQEDMSRQLAAIWDEIKADRKTTNERITRLEHDKWYQRGAAAAVSAAIVLLWNLLTSPAGQRAAEAVVTSPGK